MWISTFFLLWLGYRTDAATTFLPGGSTNAQRARCHPQTISSSSQLFIATDPFSSSQMVEPYWLPPHRRRNSVSPNAWPLEWTEWMQVGQAVASVLQISLETLLGLLDVLAKQVTAFTWEEIQKVTLVPTEMVREAVDPGDLLGQHAGWQAYFDRADTCLIYYFQPATGISQWDPPFANYPIPQLNALQLELVRQRYHQSNTAASSTIPQSSFMSQEQVNLFDSMRKGMQDLLFQKTRQNQKPDDDEDTPSSNAKPWWLSMIDNVFDSNAKMSTVNPSSNVVAPSVRAEPARATEDPVPFFAAFQEANDVTVPKKEKMARSSSSSSSEPTADLTTALSPLWDLFTAVVRMAAAPPAPTNSSLAMESSSAPPSAPKPWDFFFQKTETTTAAGWNPLPTKSEKAALTLATKSSTKEPLMNKEVESHSTKGFSSWMSDLPLFLTRDATRTIPLFGLLEKQAALLVPKKETSSSNPSTKTTAVQKSDQDRLKLLEEKRYAASRARQANLRRAYGTVIHDRSPTVSLTSIKLNKKKNANTDWYKYLDD